MDEPNPRSSIGPLLILSVLLFIVVPIAAALYLDFRWFGSLGFVEVLTKKLTAQLGLSAGAALVSGSWLYANLRMTQRFAGRSPALYLYDQDGLPRVNLGALAGRLIVPATLVVAVLSALTQNTRWERWLLALHGGSFGQKDAIFGRDVGFYVFVMPVWNDIVSFALFVVGASAVGCAALYAARGALQVSSAGVTRIERKPRVHLSILVALLLLVLAVRSYFEMFDILYSTLGPMTGASYADVHAKLPALRLAVATAVLAAALVLLSARREGLGLALLAAVLYGATQVAVRAYPSVVHRFSVAPNELEREAPYLRNNIEATRKAYGLDRVTERELPGGRALSAADIANNRETIDNIRLWDHQPLLDTFAQIQEIRTYYDFASVDNDRYVLGGKLQQTMLSPRELSAASLPNRNWINEHFTFTHGYGLTLGPVDQATSEGLPVLFVQDIPPISKVPELEIKQPAIYFGERSNDYAFVRTRGREFDYPAASGNVQTDYAGKDGVRLDSGLMRLALSIKLGSLKVLLSDDLTSDSRVLLHRNIRERLGRIAPFLVFDEDPYMVVRENGTLAWICDAYTASTRYPNSEISQTGVSYIRNAVKAVVDAYDGTVTLYVADDKDPIVRAWRSAFPNSFTPLAKMPRDLRAHLRYPELAFDIQTEMFAVYHMTSSELLYNREDQWEVPAITRGETKQAMRPYYTVMKLPGEKTAEFILMLPFTPKRKDNLAAWMVARSDGKHLGELVVYRFPKDRLVYGPQQVVNRINQDAEISRQIALWDQRGSKAELGTLLVVPIEESLVYVRPLYLRSEGGKIPELKRVIVAHENQIAMAPSLREAMDAVFGPKGGRAVEREASAAAAAKPESDPSAPSAPPVEAAPPEAGTAPARALFHFERAVEAQRAGDWARYGVELRAVEAQLRAMQPAP
jgi:uncharacterized membrane protein (UPF0182 family)